MKFEYRQKRHSEGHMLALQEGNKQYAVIQDGRYYVVHSMPYDYMKDLEVEAISNMENIYKYYKSTGSGWSSRSGEYVEAETPNKNFTFDNNKSFSGKWIAPHSCTYKITISGAGAGNKSDAEEKVIYKEYKKGDAVRFSCGTGASESCHTDH